MGAVASSSEFDPDRILMVLDRHRVEYVLVGGVAARVHGAQRATADIDCVPATSHENFERLAAALVELGARLRVGGMTDEEARQLPLRMDAATLSAFGSSTWTTDAGPCTSWWNSETLLAVGIRTSTLLQEPRRFRWAS